MPPFVGFCGCIVQAEQYTGDKCARKTIPHRRPPSPETRRACSQIDCRAGYAQFAGDDNSIFERTV